jgi:hypothetical protein
MFLRALRSLLFLLIFIALLAACSQQTEPSPTEIPIQQSQPTEDTPPSPVPTEVVLPTEISIPTSEEGESVDPDKNILVVIEGEARISQDNGNSWTATGTGQYLVKGDEVQLSEDGIALIFFFNGAVLRLEGPSDYQLMLAETDKGSGATQIIGRLWEGYALFESNPLPTPDSIFQLYVMTSFINIEYDENIAALGTSIDLDPDSSIIAGGVLNEESEMLYHFRGSASMVVLDWEEDEYIAVEYQGNDESVTSLDIGFVDDFVLESNLEWFTDIAGLLIHQYKQSRDLESSAALGYSLYEIEEQDTGEILYFFEMEVAAEIPSSNLLVSYFNPQSQIFKLTSLIQPNPTPTPGTQMKPTYLGRVTYRTSTALLYAARNPQATTTEVKILYTDQAGFGCNPYSGYGCPAPAGCDQGSGDRCTLSTGCNVVTKEGCKKTTVTCKKYGQYRDGALIGTKLVCPASKQPGCNPNISGDCDKFYSPDAWKKFEEDDDDDIEWCWCRAKVPPGWPPPPPWKDMYYRCWCSDPGAVPIKP